MAKATSGSVGVESVKGKLRLRLPRSVSTDTRYLSTGLQDTPENYKKVQTVAWQIETAISTGEADLSKYLVALKPSVSISTYRVDLMELWVRYCEYMRPQLAVTTYLRDYARKYTNHIRALPSHDLAEAIAIRDFLVMSKSPGTVKRVLTYLSACCRWAVKSHLAASNPFEGMAAEVKVCKVAKGIDPFNLREMGAIIAAFEGTQYCSLVKFLFLTGCRMGEAIALQWGSVNPDCSVVTFEASYDSQLALRKDTKTHTVRQFPCNSSLRALLLAIRPSEYTCATQVFTSPKGLPINGSKFTTQVWKGCRAGSKVYKGVVGQLVGQGAIDRYRCPYNARHTYITMALEAGVPIPLLAKWVGNSPEVLMRHYAGTLVRMDSPVSLP